MDNSKMDDKLRLPPVERSPYLVYTYFRYWGTGREDDELKNIQTFCTIEEGNHNNFYNKSIPQLRGRSICGSCHGWLILLDVEGYKFFHYFLWNPLTLELLSLPPLHKNFSNSISSWTLITSNDDEDHEKDSIGNNVSVVLLFFRDEVFSYRPTSKSGCSLISSDWVIHGLEYDGKRFQVDEVVTLNKIIYAWAQVYDHGSDIRDQEPILLSIEVANDATNSFSIKPLQIDQPKSGTNYIKLEEYLVESCGHVYYICVYRCCWDYCVSTVKVSELDLAGKKWVKVNSLDGRAFFLGRNCSTWCWGSKTTTSCNSLISSGGGGGGSGCARGDCIYFNDQRLSDKYYFCYSLNEDTLSLFLSCPESLSHQAPIWLNLTPQHHSLLGVPDMKGQELTQTKENIDEGFDHEMINYSTKYKECHGQEMGRQGQRSRFSELPNDLIKLISKYMHLFDLWNFRASCKTFQIAVPQPQHRINKMLPLFVVLKNDGRSCELIDQSLSCSCSSILQLSSDPFAIEFFKDGWLLISVGSKRKLKYFNPFSRVSGDFPTVGTSHFSSIGFSTYPTSTDCVTVAIAYHDNAIVIHHIKYGDELWESFEFPINDYDYDYENDDGDGDYGPGFVFGTNSPIYLAGTFYVLDKIGNLGAFTLVDGKGSWRVYKRRPDIWCSDYDRVHLVKSDGELYCVLIHGFAGDKIEVFKFNLLEENWSEVKSLGNHSFFLSRASSFSVEITEAGMQNRIYLSRLKGNSILFYSLDTGMYHVSDSEETMEDLFGTQEPLRCCWL